MFSSEVDHAWQVVLGRKRLSKIAKKLELQLHSKLHDAGLTVKALITPNVLGLETSDEGLANLEY